VYYGLQQRVNCQRLLGVELVQRARDELRPDRLGKRLVGGEKLTQTLRETHGGVLRLDWRTLAVRRGGRRRRRRRRGSGEVGVGQQSLQEALLFELQLLDAVDVLLNTLGGGLHLTTRDTLRTWRELFSFGDDPQRWRKAVTELGAGGVIPQCEAYNEEHPLVLRAECAAFELRSHRGRRRSGRQQAIGERCAAHRGHRSLVGHVVVQRGHQIGVVQTERLALCAVSRELKVELLVLEDVVHRLSKLDLCGESVHLAHA